MSLDPILIAYSVQRQKGQLRAYWQRIGEAFPHDESAGLTILLHTPPSNGRIVLLELDADDDRRIERLAASRLRRMSPPQRRRS